MIKKNTRVIFEGEERPPEEWGGGIPLSVGELITIRPRTGGKEVCEVKGKNVEVFLDRDDQIINVTYTLRKEL